MILKKLKMVIDRLKKAIHRKHDTRGAPRRHSVLTKKQAKTLDRLAEVGISRKKGNLQNDNLVEQLKVENHEAFEIVDWGVVAFHLASAILYLYSGEWPKFAAAMASMLSSLGSILKRNYKSIAHFFRRKK